MWIITLLGSQNFRKTNATRHNHWSKSIGTRLRAAPRLLRCVREASVGGLYGRAATETSRNKLKVGCQKPVRKKFFSFVFSRVHGPHRYKYSSLSPTTFFALFFFSFNFVAAQGMFLLPCFAIWRRMCVFKWWFVFDDQLSFWSYRPWGDNTRAFAKCGEYLPVYLTDEPTRTPSLLAATCLKSYFNQHVNFLDSFQATLVLQGHYVGKGAYLLFPTEETQSSFPMMMYSRVRSFH